VTISGDRPLRVLMVCQRYLPDMGGLETHVHEVARRLSRTGNFEITILTTDLTRHMPRQEVIDGVTVIRVPAYPRTRDYYFAPGLASVIGRRDRWDLVHCQGINTAVPIVAMLAARRAGIPYAVTFHTGGHTSRLRNSMRSVQWRIAGRLLRGAAMLIGVSRFEAETMSAQARLGNKPVTVIRNGGTLPPPAAGTTAIPGRIVSCGRLERYKGHHRVIEALPRIIREVPDAHLVVLGRGPYEADLLNLAERCGVADRVEIRDVPPADRVAMATALAQASVVAALSDYEAHPVAVMEALSVGRPVVGYSCTGIGELVDEGLVEGVAPGSPAATVARELVDVMAAPLPSDPPELPTWDASARQLGRCYYAATA
jgi:glycosyltransferase involved in cell wall biosynthesis